MRVKDIGGTLRRVARAGVALLTGLAVLAAGAVSAQAVQKNGMPGYWFNPASDDSGWWVGRHGSGLGPKRYEGDNPVYCIEAGYQYTEGKRKGTINPGIRNGNGRRSYAAQTLLA